MSGGPPRNAVSNHLLVHVPPHVGVKMLAHLGRQRSHGGHEDDAALRAEVVHREEGHGETLLVSWRWGPWRWDPWRWGPWRWGPFRKAVRGPIDRVSWPWVPSEFHDLPLEVHAALLCLIARKVCFG